MLHGSNDYLVAKHFNCLETWSACIYSGDVDQNGIIDLTDYSIIDTDAFNVSVGLRIPSDLSGDNIVDLHDLQIADYNVRNFIGVISP